MVHPVKCILCRANSQSLIPWIHMKGGESQLHILSSDLYMHCPHSLHTITSQLWCQTPLIPQLGGQRQAKQGYRMRPCLNKYILGVEMMAQWLRALIAPAEEQVGFQHPRDNSQPPVPWLQNPLLAYEGSWTHVVHINMQANTHKGINTKILKDWDIRE